MSNDKIDVTLDVDTFFNTLKKDPAYADRLDGLDTWSDDKKKEVMQELINEADVQPSKKSTFKV